MCEIWLHEEQIGDFDTQFRSLRQTRAHELKCLGLWIRAQNFAHIAPARSNIAQPSGRTSQLGPLSQLVSAVHSIRGLSALIVLTSIPVLRVELCAPLKAVIFVPQAKPPLQNQQRVCALPTPIKIDRLLPLLQGYVVKVVLMLFEGFSYGFPLHFEGGHTSFC